MLNAFHLFVPKRWRSIFWRIRSVKLNKCFHLPQGHWVFVDIMFEYSFSRYDLLTKFPHIPLYGSYRGTFHNEPLLNDFLYQEIVKYMKKTLDITKSRHSEHILPVLWPFVISRFQSTSKSAFQSRCTYISAGWRAIFQPLLPQWKKTTTTKTKRLLKVKTDRKSPPVTLVPPS